MILGFLTTAFCQINQLHHTGYYRRRQGLSTPFNFANKGCSFATNARHILYYHTKQKLVKEKAIKSNCCFFCNENKTNEQQQRRRLAHQSNKGQQFFQTLFFEKSNCRTAFLLPQLKGFSFCLDENSLIADENDKNQPKTPGQQCDRPLDYSEANDATRKCFGVEKLHFLHFLVYLEGFECLFD